MANTRELRRRIRSVKNTSQITKAMQMVAATKMRKSQNQALSGRPYNQILNYSLSVLVPSIEEGLHPLLQGNDASRIGVLLLSTDKSLCGALNTNLFRAVQNFANEHKNVSFFTVGKKGRDFTVKTGKDLTADFENHEAVTFKNATQTARLLIQQFNEQLLSEVYVIYPDFISALRQEPKIVKLLPVDPEYLKRELTSELESRKSDMDKNKDLTDRSDFKFEPNLKELLEYILVHFVETKIYQAMLETKASEWSARMIAMQNATDNAKELVSDLTLSYNQTRQAAITNELLEITSASAALE